MTNLFLIINVKPSHLPTIDPLVHASSPTEIGHTDSAVGNLRAENVLLKDTYLLSIPRYMIGSHEETLRAQQPVRQRANQCGASNVKGMNGTFLATQ